MKSEICVHNGKLYFALKNGIYSDDSLSGLLLCEVAQQGILLFSPQQNKHTIPRNDVSNYLAVHAEG